MNMTLYSLLNKAVGAALIAATVYTPFPAFSQEAPKPKDEQTRIIKSEELPQRDEDFKWRIVPTFRGEMEDKEDQRTKSEYGEVFAVTPIGGLFVSVRNREGDKNLISSLNIPHGSGNDKTEKLSGREIWYRARWYGEKQIGSFDTGVVLGIGISNANVGHTVEIGHATEKVRAYMAGFRAIGTSGLFDESGIERLSVYNETNNRFAVFTSLNQTEERKLTASDLKLSLPRMWHLQIVPEVTVEQRSEDWVYDTFRVPDKAFVLYPTKTDGALNRVGGKVRWWFGENKSFIGLGGRVIEGGYPGRYDTIDMKGFGVSGETFLRLSDGRAFSLEIGYEQFGGDYDHHRQIVVTRKVGPFTIPFNDRQMFHESRAEKDFSLNGAYNQQDGDNEYLRVSTSLGYHGLRQGGVIDQWLVGPPAFGSPKARVWSQGDGFSSETVSMNVNVGKYFGDVDNTRRWKLGSIAKRRWEVSVGGSYDMDTHDVTGFVGVSMGFPFK